MEKGDLIALWLAQGFLYKHETSNSTMEEIGEGILDILMQHLFLQEEKNEITGRIMSYKMHDLLHDLALYISCKELLVWKEKAKLSSGPNYRHLAVHLRLKHTISEFPAEVTKKNLRTINLWAGSPRDLFQANYLRTLKIDGLGLKIVPPAIGELKLLRYLDLSNNPIQILPESITKLYQLQTLKLQGCKQLMDLPRGLHRLVNLRHIPTLDQIVFAPSGLQQLTCLQTLPALALRSDEGWSIDELGFLKEVQDELCISGLEHVKGYEQAWNAGLQKKVKVVRLRLIWSESRATSSTDTDEEVLNGLEPHPYITTLVIGNYNGETFPSWIMRMAVKTENQRSILSPLSNLKGIKLVGCKRCQQLPPLGQLPFLRYLYLNMVDVVCIDDHFYVSNQNSHMPERGLFPELRELRIWNFYSLKKWMQPSLTLRVPAFASLEILEVMNCPLLDLIPALEYKSLKCLRIQELAGTQPLDIVRQSRTLTSLEVCDILNMRSLTQEFSGCTHLQKLNIWSCKELKSLPNGLHFPASLKTMDIRDCPALYSLPTDVFQNLSSLYKLGIHRCNELTAIPTSLQECKSLKELDINQCPLIEAPLPDLGMLQGLEYLHVVEAGKLTTSVLALQNLTRLMEFGIGGFKDELEFENYFVNMAPFLIKPSISLKRLLLQGSPSIKSLPEEIQLFSTVTVLFIKNFDELEELPDWIGKLSSLEELCLCDCKNLELLTSQQVVRQLTEFWHLEVQFYLLLVVVKLQQKLELITNTC